MAMSLLSLIEMTLCTFYNDTDIRKLSYVLYLPVWLFNVCAFHLCFMCTESLVSKNRYQKDFSRKGKVVKIFGFVVLQTVSQALNFTL